MGAVAVIALLAGGPLGMCLALAYGVVSIIRIAKVDAHYARKGQLPPSARLVEKWLEGRKARGEAPADAKVAPYGAWAYAKQRWHAMWEDLGDKHREEREARKNAVAEAKAKGLPIPAKPTLRERVSNLKSWKWWINGTPKLATAKPAETSDGLSPAADDTAAAPEPATDGPRTACPDCGQTLTDKNGTWHHPSSAGCPRYRDDEWLTPDPDEASLLPPPTAEEIVAADAEKAAEDARTRSMLTAGQQAAGGNPINEGNTMTVTTQTAQTSGEVVGLMSAINYAEAVAAAHEAHSLGGGESYMASLGSAKVGPATIASAGAAQEASQIAAAAWRAHAAKLKEQLAAKEAVTAETGTKEFLLSD